MRVLVLIFSAIVSIPSLAGTVSAVNGASGFTPASTGVTATVFAGMAGTCPGGSTGATCNTCDTATMVCATAPLCACNTAKPNDGGTISMTLSGSGTLTGNVALQVTVGSTTSLVTATTPGTTATAFDWTNLCTKSDSTGATATCAAVAASASVNGKLFRDANGNGTPDTNEETADVIIKFVTPGADYDVHGAVSTDGIGGTQGFVPFPGDEKIRLTEIESSDNFPNMSYGAKITGVRVWHSDVAMSQAIVGSADPRTLSVGADGSLGNSVVDGLDNDKAYVFRIALVDEASNVVQFFPGDVSATFSQCETAPFNSPALCPWTATPEQVLGLLTDDFNCFIATAAYGSALEPKLKVFREFRFKTLLRKPWGKKFVYWYYKFGPQAARYIHDKPVLRAAARAGLYPFYLFAASANAFGFVKTLIVSLSLIAACTATFVFGLRRVFARA